MDEKEAPDGNTGREKSKSVGYGRTSTLDQSCEAQSKHQTSDEQHRSGVRDKRIVGRIGNEVEHLVSKETRTRIKDAYFCRVLYLGKLNNSSLHNC